MQCVSMLRKAYRSRCWAGFCTFAHNASSFMTTATNMTDLIARPFEFDPERWTLLLDKCSGHRPWFDDAVWNDSDQRRMATSGYLVDAATNGILWEVWQGGTLTGVILLNRLHFGRDACAHFIFFDHVLRDKQRLCISGLAWAFENLKLDIIRVEVPTYARALAHWARKRLGFRYEAEARPLVGSDTRLDAKTAELGSRRYRAVRYEGKLHDVMLLSLSRQEFKQTHERTFNQPKPSQRSATTGLDGRSGELASGVSSESTASSSGPPADERTPATDWEHVQSAAVGATGPATDGRRTEHNQ